MRPGMTISVRLQVDLSRVLLLESLEEASLTAQVGVNAVANVAAGVVERSIDAGHVTVGSAKDVATDAAIGAAGPLLSAAGGKIARAINGKDTEALGRAAEGAHLGERHSASLQKQAAAASAFDEAGRKAGDNAAKVVDGANRAHDNINRVNDNLSKDPKLQQ